MEKFIKQFGRPIAKQSATKIEYRGFSDLDRVHMQAVRLLDTLGIGYSIEKNPQLKGFTIYF